MIDDPVTLTVTVTVTRDSDSVTGHCCVTVTKKAGFL